MPFPLPFIPRLDYHKSPAHARWFGARREGGRRLHAGCDLIAPAGTEIYAVEDGIVYEVATHFYHGTGVIALRHASGKIVRYCEVDPKSVADVKVEQKFSAGEVVAKVGQMSSSAMLHFEVYTGVKGGSLSQKTSSSKFKRRADLANPTAVLDYLKRHLRICHGAIPSQLFVANAP